MTTCKGLPLVLLKIIHFKHLTLHLSFGICQWFPNFAAHSKYLGMFRKYECLTLVEWTATRELGFFKGPISDSKLQPNLEVSELNTSYLVRRLGEAGDLYTVIT